MKKTTLLSIIMIGLLTVVSPIGTVAPFTITASASASQSQIDQLKSDMLVIENHITRISYIKSGKSTNKYNVTCALQRTLNILYNAGLSVDGGYGKLSVNAVKKVQCSAGLTADGIVGTGTLKVIRAKADAYIAENTYVSTDAFFESMIVPTSVKRGNSFNLEGTIRTAGSKIWYVTGQIIDNSTNRSLFYERERVSEYTYNIRSGLINKNLRFGKLSQGDYTLRYDISTMNGYTFAKTYSFTVYEEPSCNSVSSENGYKLIDAALLDKGKNYKDMGFPWDTPWCARSVGKWLSDIGIYLGDTPSVNDVVNNLVVRGYVSEAYCFKNPKGIFTAGRLTKACPNSIAVDVENRYSVDIKPGDIICTQKRNSKHTNYDHIAIVVAYDSTSRIIKTIDGNGGNGTNNTRKVDYHDVKFDDRVVAIVRLK